MEQLAIVFEWPEDQPLIPDFQDQDALLAQEHADWVKNITNEEIAILREGMIKKGMEAVVDNRVSRLIRHEWWDWIISDEIAPFSFVVCAEEMNVDPKELREQFRDLVRRKFNKNYIYTEENEHDKHSIAEHVLGNLGYQVQAQDFSWQSS